jgi:hypothetical protein
VVLGLAALAIVLGGAGRDKTVTIEYTCKADFLVTDLGGDRYWMINGLDAAEATASSRALPGGAARTRAPASWARGLVERVSSVPGLQEPLIDRGKAVTAPVRVLAATEGPRRCADVTPRRRVAQKRVPRWGDALEEMVARSERVGP